MAQNNEVNSAGVNWNFNSQYHNPTYPAGVPDPLTTAVQATQGPPLEQHYAPPLAQVQADAAKDKLAQEAFVADPGAMRKVFPKLLSDMEKEFPKDYFNDHLNLVQIEKGLKDKNLSQEDKNLLTVFKAGYNVLTESPTAVLDDTNHPTMDHTGVSAESLAMIDKAVNRSINEDPYFRAHIWTDPFAKAAISAGGSALLTYGFTRDKTSALIAAGFGAIAGAVTGIVHPLVFKYEGGETEMYDHVKDDYLIFSNAFKKPTT